MTQYSWQAIDAEIPAKGKGYLIVKEQAPDRAAGALREGAAALLDAGAVEVYVTGLQDALVKAGPLPLEEAYEMVWMERSLAALDRPGGRLTLQPMEQQEGGKFLALYNECFFDVPNSATYTKNDLTRMEQERCEAGFALLDGVPVGIYECRPDADMTELHSLGLVKRHRGQGLGRELTLGLMEMLRAKGETRCKLLTSTANEPACGLYRALGFTRTGVESKWYRLHTDQL